MADSKNVDPFVSKEEPLEIDDVTRAAIECGIKAADEGRVVSNEEARKRLSKWITEFSTQSRP